MRSPARFVLGFFPGESGNSTQAYRGAIGAAARACLFRADGTIAASHDFCARYGGLRLPGESLVIARVSRESVPRIADDFQREGSSGVFVLPDPSAAPEHRVERKKDRLLAKLHREEMKFDEACLDLEEAL